MADFTANFELGVNSNTVAAADPGSATAWDSVTISAGGALTYDNAHAYGLLSAKFNNDASTTFTRLRWSSLPNPTESYGRFYLYITSYPSNRNEIFTDGENTVSINLTALAGDGGVVRVGTLSGFVDGTVAVAINQWVRIEWHLIHNAVTGLLEVKLFNNPDSTVPTETINSTADKNTGAANAFADFQNYRVAGPEAYILWMDNIVANATSYPGPIITGTANLAPVIYGRGAC